MVEWCVLESDRDFAAAVINSGLVTPERVAEVLHRWSRSRASSPLAREFLDEGLLSEETINRLHKRAQRDRRLGPQAFHTGERYVQRRRIGAGGMGVVYDVLDTSLNRRVALKTPHSKYADDIGMCTALLAEARVTGRLQHPNIIPIYDIGLSPSGVPYYTMRLMRTQSLGDVLAMLRREHPEVDRAYPLRRLLRIFLQVCRAIDYAHGVRVIHRDIKPSNVRIGQYGGVQLADWGLAKVIGESDGVLERAKQSAAIEGASTIVIGSPNYMSPEQARGDHGAVDERSDIWSLGVVLYELLTLTPPFLEQDTQVLFEKIETLSPDAPSEVAGRRIAPSQLSDVCMRLLDKEPSKRPPNVRSVALAIEDYLDSHNRDRQ